ncbi:MAG: UrcA family protein [Hyphomonadaceae bacterium]
MRIAILSACVLMLGAASAMAQPNDGEARAVPVRYADLDLNNSSDAQSMLSRLRYAAMRACAAEMQNQEGPGARRAIAECRDSAVEAAVAQIDEAELTRLHQAQR